MKYEYLAIPDLDYEWKDAEKQAIKITNLLNEYANHGWELIQFYNGHIYFRRLL